jgi:hypothetical protein
MRAANASGTTPSKVIELVCLLLVTGGARWEEKV